MIEPERFEAIKAISRIEGAFLNLPTNALRDTQISKEIKTILDYLTKDIITKKEI